MHPASQQRYARAAATVLALMLGGCANTEAVRYGEVQALPGAYASVPAPLSLGEIVAEVRAGRLPADLAADIRERGLLAPARGADLDLLRREGAGNEVVDAVRDESAEMSSVPPAVVGATAPPVVIVPRYYYDYGWYPWVPFSFGLWWYGGHGYHHDRPAPGVWGHRPPPGARPPPGPRPPPVARPPSSPPPLPSPRAPGPFKPAR